MGLKEESAALFVDLLGPEVAKALDAFDNPDKYPREFLDECIFFLGRFIGEDAAKKKFEPIAKEYHLESEVIQAHA